MVMVIVPEHRLPNDKKQITPIIFCTHTHTPLQYICPSWLHALEASFEIGCCLLTSTTFLMCLLTTDGSGLVVTPDAQSSGARGLFGVVGEVGCEEGYGTQDQRTLLHLEYRFSTLHIVPWGQKVRFFCNGIIAQVKIFASCQKEVLWYNTKGSLTFQHQYQVC